MVAGRLKLQAEEVKGSCGQALLLLAGRPVPPAVDSLPHLLQQLVQETQGLLLQLHHKRSPGWDGGSTLLGGPGQGVAGSGHSAQINVPRGQGGRQGHARWQPCPQLCLVIVAPAQKPAFSG